MGIFIPTPYLGGSADQSARQAFEVLREAGVAFARTGESTSDQAVVLVDLPDLAKALAVLGKARMGVLDSASKTTLSTLDTQPRFLVASSGITGRKLLRHAVTGTALALALAALIIAGVGPSRRFILLAQRTTPCRLAIVSGAALLSRWLPFTPHDPHVDKIKQNVYGHGRSRMR
jgi:hypothetical protein